MGFAGDFDNMKALLAEYVVNITPFLQEFPLLLMRPGKRSGNMSKLRLVLANGFTDLGDEACYECIEIKRIRFYADPKRKGSGDFSFVIMMRNKT